MRIASSSLLLLALAESATGFSLLAPSSARRSSRPQQQSTILQSSSGSSPYVEPLMDMPETAPAKQQLLSVCERLKNENGVFLVDKDARDQLLRAVDDLESRSEPPGSNAWDQTKKLFVGDWTLLCTTTTSSSSNLPVVLDRSKLPSFLSGPLQTLTNQVSGLSNKYVKVQQRIRTDPNTGDVTRVDHVIEYAPPKTLKEVLSSISTTNSNAPPSIPDALAGLDLNPLEVSKSKLVLVHKATVDTASTNLSTRLTLQSVVLNVAGTSRVLDPQGKDVAALNLPTAFFNLPNDFIKSAGDSFETIYMDDTLRISRGKLGVVDQLRVFVKQTSSGDDTMRQTDMDVDEAMDPEFVYEEEEASANGDAHEGQDDVSPSDY
jgi:hypothetical protein